MLPSVLVEQADMMIINVELSDGKIPFGVFDRLRTEQGIDVTALQYSQTPGGNIYRAYVLMR